MTWQLKIADTIRKTKTIKFSKVVTDFVKNQTPNREDCGNKFPILEVNSVRKHIRF